MLDQMTFEAIHNATSSPASGSGAMPSGLQAGPTTSPSGPEAAPVRRSRRQAKGSDAQTVAAAVISAILARPDISSASIADVIATPTIDTSGLNLRASSESEILQSSLASRLRASRVGRRRRATMERARERRGGKAGRTCKQPFSLSAPPD